MAWLEFGQADAIPGLVAASMYAFEATNMLKSSLLIWRKVYPSAFSTMHFA